MLKWLFHKNCLINKTQDNLKHAIIIPIIAVV